MHQNYCAPRAKQLTKFMKEPPDRQDESMASRERSVPEQGLRPADVPLQEVLPLGPRYELLGLLGSGGMGQVWKARDRETHEMVAIKVLKPEVTLEPGALERFKNELRLARRITHKNVCRIYEFNRVGNTAYISMEYIEGQSLRSALRRAGALPQDEATRIVRQICNGLAEAHQQGIVHRDLKPENVMMDSAGVVKLMDFGLARFLTTDSTTTAVAGTPAYMAPEQALGLATDHRADIYSLGLMFYEMVTGSRPFPADSPIQAMLRRIQETPTPPRELQPDLPQHLESAILKCLEKEPERRFQSIVELQQTLESGEAVPPALLSKTTATSRASRLGKLKMAGWAVAVLLVVTAALFWYRHAHYLPIPEQKNLVVLPFTALGGGPDQIYCDGLTETVTTKLTGVRALQVLPISQVKDRKADTPEKARRELGANLVLRATWQRAGPHVRINMSLLDSRSGLALRSDTITASASDLFGLQDEVVNDMVQMLEVALQAGEASELGAHGTQQPSAYDYYLRGVGYLQDYTKLANVNSAVSVFNQALQQDPRYALAFAGLGQAYWRGYLLTHESEWLDDALNACRRSLEVDPISANGHACLGVVYNEKGEYERAAAELERAVRLNPNADDFLRGLANAYQKLGRTEDAEKTFRNAIALCPQYWANYSYLGYFYWSRGRYNEAAAMFQQVVKLAPDSFRGYSNLGGTYVALDRLDEAFPVLEHSIQIFPTASAYSNLGTVYLSRRQFPEAARWLEQAVKLEGRYGFWGNLGEALYFISERRAESVHPFQEAIRLAQKRLQDSPRDGDALSSLAYFEAMTGAHEAARSRVTQALAATSGEAAYLIRLAKASSQLGDDKQTIELIEKALAAGKSPTAITDAPHFDGLRARSVRLRELLVAAQSKNQKRSE